MNYIKVIFILESRVMFPTSALEYTNTLFFLRTLIRILSSSNSPFFQLILLLYERSYVYLPQMQMNYIFKKCNSLIFSHLCYVLVCNSYSTSLSTSVEIYYKMFIKALNKY